MNERDIPIVVYHVATMGNWHEVIREQFLLLRECGLAQALADIGDKVRLTHVGQHLDIVLEEAARQNVPVTVVRSDPNTDHYETFAMLEIDRLAKDEKVQRHLLYFHTKGVSRPDAFKTAWRHAMSYYVLKKWRENVGILWDLGYDAVGLNWVSHGEQHFSGTFWMARANWIRKLPVFVHYHSAKNFVRYSCEMWIGALAYCNAFSHAISNVPFWTASYNFQQILPPPLTSHPSLTNLFHKYPSDKAAAHSYVSVYEELLAPLRESVTSLLELGIDYGDSLRVWRDFFPNAVVVGIDNNYKRLFHDERIETYVADQSDRQQLDRELRDKSFDIIIDDASHKINDQILSVFYLWSRLRPGGLYIIEDIQDASLLDRFYCFANATVHDLRGNKGRYDDLLVVLQKPHGSGG